jgi:hypothetical protein
VRFARLALLASIMLLVPACSTPVGSLVSGSSNGGSTDAGSTGATSPVASFTTWSAKDGQGMPFYFIFSADGTCRYGNLALPQGIPCTYLASRDVVTVKAGGSETFAIKGDTMIGRGLTWQKVPNGSLTWVVSDPCAGASASGPVTVTSWPNASSIQAGQTLQESSLSGGQASAPGRFDYAQYKAMNTPGTFNVDVEFHPTCGAKVTGQVALTVTAAVPRVASWPTAAPLTVGDRLYTGLLSGGVVFLGNQGQSRAGQWRLTDLSLQKVAGKVKVPVQFDDMQLGPIVSGEIEIQVNHVVVERWPQISVWLGQPLSDFGYYDDQENRPGRGTFSLEPGSFVPKTKGTCKATLVFTEMYTGFRETKAVNVTVR